MVPMEDYIFSHNYIPWIQLIGPDLEGEKRLGEGRGIEYIEIDLCRGEQGGGRERTKWHTDRE